MRVGIAIFDRKKWRQLLNSVYCKRNSYFVCVWVWVCECECVCVCEGVCVCVCVFEVIPSIPKLWKQFWTEDCTTDKSKERRNFSGKAELRKPIEKLLYYSKGFSMKFCCVYNFLLYSFIKIDICSDPK